MLKFGIFFLLFSSLVFSDFARSKEGLNADSAKKIAKNKRPRKPAQNGLIHVVPVDPQFSAEGFEAGYQVHQQDDQVIKEIPPAEIRDRYFGQAGVLVYVQRWDQLERDILWMRSRKQSLEQLQKKYPQIPGANLNQLIRAGR